MKKNYSQFGILAAGIAIGSLIPYLMNLKEKPQAAVSGISNQAPSGKVVIYGQVTGMVGKITKISGDIITVEGVAPRPEGGIRTVVKRVQVASGAEVVRVTPRDLIEFNRRFSVYVQAGKPESLHPGDPVVKEKISLSDLRVGDRVSAQTNEDVQHKETFLAKKIVLEMPPSFARK
jgi:hypothetical protein